MSVRSLNGLSSVFVNTIQAGDAISVSSSGSSISTINLDISKQSANTTIADTDLFVLEDNAGNIKKITGANLKSENSFWTYSSPSLRPDNTSDNVLLGTTSNSNSRKLIVVGDSEFADVYMPTDKKIISTNDSTDYLQFGNGTLTNNYNSNLITNTLVMGSSASVAIQTGNSITRLASATDKITFNDGNTTLGNVLIVDNSILINTTSNTDSRKFLCSGEGQFTDILYASNSIQLLSGGSQSQYGQGVIRFWESTESGYSPPQHYTDLYSTTFLDSNIQVFLPSSTGILRTGTEITAEITANADGYIKADSTDTLTNKTLNSTTNTILQFTGNSSSVITTPSSTGTLALTSSIPDLTTATNFGTSATSDVSLGNNSVNTDLKFLSEDILIGGATSNSNTQRIYINSGKNFNGETSVNIRAERQSDGNPQDTFIDLTTAQGASNSGTSKILLNATSSGSGVGNIEMVAKSEIIMNTGFKLNSSGVITTATYNGTAIGVAYGGTGLTTYTIGDILYATGTTTLAKLAIGSNQRFLMSNGSAPFWGLGYSFSNPITVDSSLDISVAGLSGFGTNNQIVCTNGSDALQYRTLTAGTGISFGFTSSAITITGTNLSTELTTATDFGTSAASTVSLGNVNRILALIGSSIFLDYTKPITIAIVSAIAISNLISFNSSTTTMEFGEKGSSTGYDVALKGNTVGIEGTNINMVGIVDIDGQLDIANKITDNGSSTNFISFTASNELTIASQIVDFTGNFADFGIVQISKGRANQYIEHYYHASATASGMYMEESGSTRLYYNGSQALAAGNWADISDERVKLNKQLANTTPLSTAFDNIDLYTYNYTEQYALDNGKSSTDIVYGFLAQQVIEKTKNISSQFGSVATNTQTFPNSKIEYTGEKQTINDLNTINKKNLTILLWAKIKEMDSIIKNQQIVINNLLTATTFANFKKM